MQERLWSVLNVLCFCVCFTKSLITGKLLSCLQFLLLSFFSGDYWLHQQYASFEPLHYFKQNSVSFTLMAWIVWNKNNLNLLIELSSTSAVFVLVVLLF